MRFEDLLFSWNVFVFHIVINFDVFKIIFDSLQMGTFFHIKLGLYYFEKN